MRLSYKWQAAIIVAVGLFMAVLDNTVVNVALTQMARSFGTDFETIKWVATAYFLAQAAVIPVCGYLTRPHRDESGVLVGLGALHRGLGSVCYRAE